MFEALNKVVLSAPILRPPDYTRDFILYLVAYDSTIRVVLVQAYDEFQEKVVYSLSHTLSGPKLRYSHIEKLDFAAVYVVQRLRHYILLRTTIVVVDVNNFQYILSQ